MSIFTPMTRREVINKYTDLVTKYRIPNAKIWLGAGSAMIMHGLRETTLDLDVGAGGLWFDLLAKKADAKIKVYNIADGYLHDGTRMYTLPEFYADVHLEQSVERSGLVQIDGVWCYNLHTLLAQKALLAKRLGRDKDLLDLGALHHIITVNSLVKGE